MKHLQLIYNYCEADERMFQTRIKIQKKLSHEKEIRIRINEHSA